MKVTVTAKIFAQLHMKWKTFFEFVLKLQKSIPKMFYLSSYKHQKDMILKSVAVSLVERNFIVFRIRVLEREKHSNPLIAPLIFKVLRDLSKNLTNSKYNI